MKLMRNGAEYFKYHGKECGVDPLAVDEFDIWCGNEDATVKNIDDVTNTKIFDGKSLDEIYDDIECME